MAIKNLGFLGAAERVLAEAGEPLQYRGITRRALSNDWVITVGKTPEATLNAQIASQIKRLGDASTFVRTSPGVFALRRWLEEGSLDLADVKKAGRPLVPHYPLYARVRDILPVWTGRRGERSPVCGPRSGSTAAPLRARPTGPIPTSGSKSCWTAKPGTGRGAPGRAPRSASARAT